MPWVPSQGDAVLGMGAESSENRPARGVPVKVLEKSHRTDRHAAPPAKSVHRARKGRLKKAYGLWESGQRTVYGQRFAPVEFSTTRPEIIKNFRPRCKGKILPCRPANISHGRTPIRRHVVPLRPIRFPVRWESPRVGYDIGLDFPALHQYTA